MIPVLLLSCAFALADKDEAKYQFMLKKAAEDATSTVQRLQRFARQRGAAFGVDGT